MQSFILQYIEEMVYDKIIDRGWELGRDRKDEYVLKLHKF